MNEVTIGVDLGGTNLRVGAVRNGRLDATKSRPSALRSAEMDAPERVLSDMIGDLVGGDTVAAIGIAATGPVDRDARIVNNPQNLPDWSGTNWAHRLEQLIGAPVVVENDALGAAMGEFESGAGRDSELLVMVTLGTGVGVGVLDRAAGPRRGVGGSHPESGHLPLSGALERCYCGVTGCWEQLCSGEAVRTKWTDKEGVIDWLGYGAVLARGLRAVARAFGPDRIVIGGGIADNYDDFFPSVAAEFARVDPMGLPCEVVKAQLDYPAILGAAAAARNLPTVLPTSLTTEMRNS